MSFDVSGTYEDRAYRINVEPGLLDAIQVKPTDTDLIQGTPEVVALLLTRVGDEVLASPTGPSFVLDLGKPEAILAGLRYLTKVKSVDGTPPILYPTGEDHISY
jgi:hypothetical protein